MNLLLVDDEWFTREGILDNLPWRQLGIERVVQADDGVHALEAAERLRPDILLTDVRMPRMNGTDLAYRIRELYPDCHIIFMSGYTDKEYFKAAIRVSASGYVEKPINIDELRSEVEKAALRCGKNRRQAIKVLPDDVHVQNRAVTDILAFIHDRYKDVELSLDQISRHMFLSPSHICVIFKEETGMTVGGYIVRYRIAKAMEMLKDSRMKIKDVALKSGYHDSNYFTKIFKKITGSTPQEFQEKIRG
ncbi:response regulator [Paenibacillus sp. V4I5]|uniref:response regulator transcription factor n=1 Tax=Paenibacillus sp. V4I5 TaxID=3042306 RepID=UPI002792B9A7|nr:response regulator [Paenibacillus sp. V4I5]MDQ0920513.1 two-component system response regulator YesN [Paenibacillus sp. V4I5]